MFSSGDGPISKVKVFWPPMGVEKRTHTEVGCSEEAEDFIANPWASFDNEADIA